MSETPNTETPLTDDVQESTGVSQEMDAIGQLRQEAQTNLEGWQRARAEFANYKKRVEKELKDSSENGAYTALKRLIPIMDDFMRALNNIPDDLQGHPWMNGTSLILKKFDKLLEEYAIEEIDPVGHSFDPRLHEAVGTDEADETHPSGTVTATLQKGYISGERVLRPALVRVAN